MPFCNACGADNQDGAAFCASCGVSLTPAPANNQQMPNQAPPYQAPPAYNQPPYQQYQQPGQPGSSPYQQPNGQGIPVPPGYEQKSKLAAGLLQIFLGAFGVGRFYLGYTKLGVLQLVVTVVTCGAGSIWGLIDGIMILTGNPNVDANGIPLKD